MSKKRKQDGARVKEIEREREREREGGERGERGETEKRYRETDAEKKGTEHQKAIQKRRTVTHNFAINISSFRIFNNKQHNSYCILPSVSLNCCFFPIVFF